MECRPDACDRTKTRLSSDYSDGRRCSHEQPTPQPYPCKPTDRPVNGALPNRPAQSDERRGRQSNNVALVSKPRTQNRPRPQGNQLQHGLTTEQFQRYTRDKSAQIGESRLAQTLLPYADPCLAESCSINTFSSP